MREPMRKTVAVDLDGVLADYAAGWQGLDVIGDPLPGAAEFTRRLSAFARVVVFTTRAKADMSDRPPDATPEALAARVRSWLDRHGFAYDEVYAGQGKPIASAYIDDRAVPCAPQRDGPGAYRQALDAAQALCNH